MGATAKVIKLEGDPRNPESAEHIILFPGGSISVCRTTDQKYWCHIDVNDGPKGEDLRTSKTGKIERIRKDENNHFAILISTK